MPWADGDDYEPAFTPGIERVAWECVMELSREFASAFADAWAHDDPDLFNEAGEYAAMAQHYVEAIA